MTFHAASHLASVGQTRAVLQQFGLATKKALGQHFLVSDHVVQHILELAQLDSSDTVLEVGPGIGTLTVALLNKAGFVVAVERDADLLPVIAHTCQQHADRFALVNCDALDLAPRDLPRPCTTMVANLPYAVAATVVLDVFCRFESVDAATVMVQAEVAQRMAAVPGTKSYGAFSVKLGLLAASGARFNVAPGNFFPPPRVESTVIRLDRVQRKGVDGSLIAAASTMADAAFANRRKTIFNSCRTYFGEQHADAIRAVLDQAGIPPTVRGEALPLDAYIALARAAQSTTLL